MYFQCMSCSHLVARHPTFLGGYRPTNLSSSPSIQKRNLSPPVWTAQKIYWTRDILIAMELHSFLGKVCRKKKGAWSSSESNSHGTAWEITCDFILQTSVHCFVVAIVIQIAEGASNMMFLATSGTLIHPAWWGGGSTWFITIPLADPRNWDKISQNHLLRNKSCHVGTWSYIPFVCPPELRTLLWWTF